MCFIIFCGSGQNLAAVQIGLEHLKVSQSTTAMGASGLKQFASCSGSQVTMTGFQPYLMVAVHSGLEG